MAGKGGFLMLGLGKKKPGMSGMKDDMGMDDEGSGSAEEEAISDFFAKGKSGDNAGAVDALKTFMDICYPELGSESEADEYPEGSGDEEP